MYDYVTKYQPDYIWSDGGWLAPPEYWTSKEWLAWLYNDRSDFYVFLIKVILLTKSTYYKLTNVLVTQVSNM